MTSREFVLYAGGFPLPNHRAAALRAIANAKLFKAVGLSPIVLGRFVTGHDGTNAIAGDGLSMTVEGIPCGNIEAAGGRLPRAYLTSAAPVSRIVRGLGADKVFAVLAYNYPARGLADLLRYTRRLAIPLVAECTEWAGFEGRNLPRNLTRQMGSAYRMHVLARRSGHVICATDHAADHFRGQNVVTIPFVMEGRQVPPSAGNGDVMRFVYAGSPGKGFGKERIDSIIMALAELADHPRPFVLNCTLDRDAVLRSQPAVAAALERLGARVRFRGWLSREPVEALLDDSDVSVFARPNRLSTRFGFPTKVAEAYRFGLPVLANDCGDVGKYVRDGETGWLAEAPDTASLARTFRRALETPPDALWDMKRAVIGNNPFDPKWFVSPVAAFFDRVGAAQHAMGGVR